VWHPIFSQPGWHHAAHPLVTTFPSGHWIVTDANPKDDLTISDFELAATVSHHYILVGAVDLLEGTITNLHGNTATVHFKRKGAITTTKEAA
jgi:hypothetical protein